MDLTTFCFFLKFTQKNEKEFMMELEQILTTILIASVITFGALMYTAMKGELTVFHDTKDVINSVGIFIGPVASSIILGMFLDDDPSGMAMSVIAVISSIPFFWFSYQCFKVSIECNGKKWGIIIGAGKVFLSVLMILFVWGLLAKVSRGEHKNVGTMILMLVFVSAFAWILKVLINGDEAAAHRAIMNRKTQ